MLAVSQGTAWVNLEYACGDASNAIIKVFIETSDVVILGGSSVTWVVGGSSSGTPPS